MDYNKVFRTKIFRIICWIIVGLTIFLLGFKAGTAVEFRKVNFSFKWGENYHKNFGGPKGGFFKNFEQEDFLEGYGIVGQIIKIDGLANETIAANASSTSSLTIKGRKNTEQIIIIKDNTTIKKQKETISANELKINDFIVIIGEPNNQGQTEAKLIRLMPTPPTLIL